MEQQHVGLIGCGLWGANILRDLLALGARVSVVERGAEARARAEAAGAAAFERLEEMPAVDGIVVATPAATHAEVIAQSLERGVPVFTEKPFTLDMASAERLAAAAPDRLFVMHVWRYHPGIEALRDLVAEGACGPPEWLRLVRANWTSPRTDVDSVWTMLPHDVSILLEILGHLPEPVAAYAERCGGAANGIVAVLGEAPRAVIETSTRFESKRREVRVHCRDAVLVLHGTDTDRLDIHRLDPAAPTVPSSTALRIAKEPALRRELATFLAHLRGGPAPRSGMQDALKITRTVIALRRMAGLE